MTGLNNAKEILATNSFASDKAQFADDFYSCYVVNFDEAFVTMVDHFDGSHASRLSEDHPGEKTIALKCLQLNGEILVVMRRRCG